MRGQDPFGLPLPGAGDAKRSLPDAWWRQYGGENSGGASAGTDGTPEAWAAVGGEHRHAPPDPGGLCAAPRYGEGHERGAAGDGGNASSDDAAARAVRVSKRSGGIICRSHGRAGMPMYWNIAFPNEIVLAYFRLFCRFVIVAIALKLLGFPNEAALWVVAGWYALKVLDWILSYGLHLLGSVAAKPDSTKLVLGLFRKQSFHVLPDCYGLDCAAAMRMTCSHPGAGAEDKLFAAELVGMMRGVFLGSFIRSRVANSVFNAAFDQYRKEYLAKQRHNADYVRESAMHDVLNTTR